MATSLRLDDPFQGNGNTHNIIRRSSRPQNLHLDTNSSNLKHVSSTVHNENQIAPVDSSRSDSSSRSSTPTRSTASSTDESSVATPTLENSSIAPKFTFSSPTDNSTRLLLRDRYLESQRPIIVGNTGNLDIPRAVYTESTSSKERGISLLDIFTPPETPASVTSIRPEPRKSLDTSIPPPKFRLEKQSPTETVEDVEMVGIHSDTSQDSILVPSGPYSLDDPKSPTKLGSGAWSNVFKGFLHTSDSTQVLIAVKRPLNTFSIPALKREASILSHIHSKTTTSNSYISIIPFHGFDADTNSILMTGLSGENLEQFASRCRISAARETSFSSLKLPVVGVTQWLFIAERLISAFSFLKKSGVIHGDVKPQNILTKSFDGGWEGYDWVSDDERRGLIEPVVADFSSSYVVDEHGDISDDEEAINAVTTIYCAPELLAAFLTPPTTPTKITSSNNPSSNLVKTEPRPLPTFSSDQYGLCMTLLQCAIGSHPYSAAKMDIQRNMWVRQGDPMAFARADERGFRCRSGGAVDRLLKGCFGKTAEGRAGMQDLEGRIETLVGEWRGRKGEVAWVWGV